MRFCPVCGNPLPQDSAPNRIYCGLDRWGNPSNACKQAAYRGRRNERNVTLMTLVTDLTQKVDDLSDQLRQLTLPGIAQNTPSLPAGRGLGDDDLLGELEITQAKSDENPSYNMILSSFGMGIIKAHELPAEVIEYGIRKGRLDPKQFNQSRKQQPDGGPKPMSLPAVEFTPPPVDIEMEF